MTITRRVQYVLCFVMCVLAFVVYAPTFSSSLFFNNLAQEYSFGVGVERMDGARLIFHLLNYGTFSFFGPSVEAFRIQNFVLHLFAAALCFLLFSLLFDLAPNESWLYRARKKIVLTATGLFLLHPVQTQTALHVEHMRLEGLMTMLVLLALYCFLRTLRDTGLGRAWYKNGWMYSAICAAALCVGVKEACIVLPLLAVLLDFFFIAAGSLSNLAVRAWAHVVFTTSFFVVFFSVNTHLPVLEMLSGCAQVISAPGCLLTASYDQALSASTYVITQIPVLLHYLWIFFYPFGLYFEYDFALPNSVLHPAVVASALLLMALVIGAVVCWLHDKRNLAAFGLSWFFIALLPRVAFCAPSAELVADYKTFLASIGVMLLLAGVTWYFIELVCMQVLQLESWLGWGSAGALGCWVLFVVVGTTKMHAELCQSPVDFWRREVEHTPGRARSFYCLGRALQEQNSLQAAIDNYQRAIVLDEAYADPLIAVGEIYQAQGDVHRALSLYLKAEKRKYSPQLASRLFFAEGAAYLSLDDVNSAEDALKKSLHVKPVCVDAYFKYAQLLKKKMRFDEAYVTVDRYLRVAKRADVHEAEALKARLAFELGNYREVVQLLETKVTEKDDPSLVFILAAAQYSVENYKRAAELFEQVYQRCPDNLDVAYNCGQAFMRADKFAAAVGYFKQCNDASKYPFAPVHMATCLLKNGNNPSGQQLIANLQQQELMTPVRLHLAQVQQDFHLA